MDAQEFLTADYLTRDQGPCLENEEEENITSHWHVLVCKATDCHQYQCTLDIDRMCAESRAGRIRASAGSFLYQHFLAVGDAHTAMAI